MLFMYLRDKEHQVLAISLMMRLSWFRYTVARQAVKAAVLAALTAGNSASSSISVSGQGNRVAGRDYNENKK
jgi:hypothetical protein